VAIQVSPDRVEESRHPTGGRRPTATCSSMFSGPATCHSAPRTGCPRLSRLCAGCLTVERRSTATNMRLSSGFTVTRAGSAPITV
jgi:hypothetical protein